MARRRLQKRFTEQGIERLNYDPAVAPPSGRMEIEDDGLPWPLATRDATWREVVQRHLQGAG